MANLSTMCDIQIGYTARGRLEPMEGGVPALQLRDTTPEGGLSTEAVVRYRLDDVPDRYWARTGDIVFRSRGDRNTATALTEAFPGPAVAVMPLVIVRPDKAVLPEYLAWYLNQPEAQRHFDTCARGTGIRMIPMGCLADLDVPVPSLVRQRAIAAVETLARREFMLSGKLVEKRRQLLTASLLRAARESTHNQHTNTTAAARAAQGGKS